MRVNYTSYTGSSSNVDVSSLRHPILKHYMGFLQLLGIISFAGMDIFPEGVSMIGGFFAVFPLMGAQLPVASFTSYTWYYIECKIKNR